MHTLQPGKGQFWPRPGPSMEVTAQDERLGDEQHEHEQEPHAGHGVHPPERNRGKTFPKVKSRNDVESSGADDDYRGASLPNKAPLDRVKCDESIAAKITPPDRRQDNTCRHRRAADPDDDRENVQSSREGDLIHATPPVLFSRLTVDALHGSSNQLSCLCARPKVYSPTGRH